MGLEIVTALSFGLALGVLDDRTDIELEQMVLKMNRLECEQSLHPPMMWVVVTKDRSNSNIKWRCLLLQAVEE